MINEKPNASATITSCQYNTAYFNTPVYNNLTKCGRVVHVSFIAEVKAAIPTSSWILTHLPLTLDYHVERLPFLFGSTEYVPSPTFYQGGSLTNSVAEGYGILTSYAIADSYVGKFLSLNFTYIAAE